MLRNAGHTKDLYLYQLDFSSLSYTEQKWQQAIHDTSQKERLLETSTPQQQKFPIKLSTSLLPRAAIAVCGLGFIDAGYSGDWSRIGVISEETEALLKAAAFVVVPLCIFLIVYLSREPEIEA
ncbi:hypothetical protein Patl1_14489 [Pistacia atlantica]|uniref:Uncharacterized protein n=1 Tax=Pistacia atlantica TaxID=434234 RepID=A0ACC1AVM8_9ROSI|nr:hypothetical protein Patl1_14489 [Pistacia atlantica]